MARSVYSVLPMMRANFPLMVSSGQITFYFITFNQKKTLEINAPAGRPKIPPVAMK